MSISQRQAFWSPWINLVVPGSGLILIGWPWVGWLIGLLFVLSLNVALATTLLIPDEYPGWIGGLAIGLAGGTWLGAQLRLRQCLNTRQLSLSEAHRNSRIRAALEAVDAGDQVRALEALQEIASEADHDLLVAYRVAQVISTTDDLAGAREAWERVSRLDRYHLYRSVVRAELARLSAHGDTE